MSNPQAMPITFLSFWAFFSWNIERVWAHLVTIESRSFPVLLDLPFKFFMVPESWDEFVKKEFLHQKNLSCCDRGECLPVIHSVEKTEVHHEVIKSKYQRMVNHRWWWKTCSDWSHFNCWRSNITYPLPPPKKMPIAAIRISWSCRSKA